MYLEKYYEYVKDNNLFFNEKQYNIKNNHKEFKKQLKKEFGKNNYKFICNIYRAFNYNLQSFEELKIFIKNNLIDKENEISPSRLNVLINYNPEIKLKILEYTNSYPEKMSLTGRCENIIKNIKTYPNCPNCKINKVTFSNAGFIREYCSSKCSDSSEKVIKNRKITMMKKYGVDTPFKSKEIKNKAKKTMLEKYGVECSLNHKETKEKIKKIMLQKYGVENNLCNGVLREEMKKTMLEKYGVSSYVLAKDFKEKSNKTKSEKNYIIKQTYFVKTLEYKNSGIFYQGSYEKYFLELLELKNMLSLVSRGKSLYYEYKNEKLLYHPDFCINGNLIEIKSRWTYNKYGKDIEQGEKNEAKWQGAREQNFKINILFSKKEIEEYINSL